MRPDLNFLSRVRRPPVVGDIASQLRALPSEVVPPYDFAEFQRRSRERATSKRNAVTWPYAAAAAGLTAVVATMAMLGAGDGIKPQAGTGVPLASASPTGTGVSLASASTTGIGAPLASAPPPTGIGSSATTDSDPSSGRAPADPSQQARAAREWLARLPAEPAVVRPGSRLAVVSLEDRIAWFDDALSDERLRGANAAQLKVLQQQRALLMSSLAQVRYAEALVADGS